MLNELIIPAALIFGAYLLFVREEAVPLHPNGPKADMDKADRTKYGPAIESGLTPTQYHNAIADRNFGSWSY